MQSPAILGNYEIVVLVEYDIFKITKGFFPLPGKTGNLTGNVLYVAAGKHRLPSLGRACAQ